MRKRTLQVNLGLSPQVKKMLAELAAEEYRTMNSFAAWLIRNEYEARKAQKRMMKRQSKSQPTEKFTIDVAQ